jgi:hypothetical protein
MPDAILPAITFDPNGFVGEPHDGAAQFPYIEGAIKADEYVTAFSRQAGMVDFAGSTDVLEQAKSMITLAKVGVAGMVEAPEMQTFAKLSTMPNTFYRGLVQWPDLPAATLKKIAQDHFLVHTIIQQRIADVLRYAQRSSHPWKPGWTIKLRQGLDKPSASDRKEIKEAERFIEACIYQETWDPRSRDASGLTSFQNFLAGSVRDTFRFDAMAWWTDMDLQGRVRAFRALPAGNILLATRDGYEGQPEIFACGVDEAGTVKHAFTRKQLTWIIRNARTDGEAFGYGFSEITMLVRVIQAFNNAFEMNADVFTKSAIPPGLLKLKGMWTQRQVEVISRIWANLRRGATKQWALPAIPVPKDGDIELLDMSRLKDNDAYYQDFVNMLAGLASAIWQFPTKRLGYRISGKGRDAETSQAVDPAALVDEEDPGLAPMLNTLENGLNQYILWTRWPHLEFHFHGKNPKEDAREYEARQNASTLNELRAMADLEPLEDCVEEEDHKELAQLMALTPKDAGMAGVWQALVSAYIGGENAEKEAAAQPEISPGGADPARKLGHGHQAGVRRNSAREKGKTGA